MLQFATKTFHYTRFVLVRWFYYRCRPNGSVLILANLNKWFNSVFVHIITTFLGASWKKRCTIKKTAVLCSKYITIDDRVTCLFTRQYWKLRMYKTINITHWVLNTRHWRRISNALKFIVTGLWCLTWCSGWKTTDRMDIDKNYYFSFNPGPERTKSTFGFLTSNTRDRCRTAGPGVMAWG